MVSKKRECIRKNPQPRSREPGWLQIPQSRGSRPRACDLRRRPSKMIRDPVIQFAYPFARKTIEGGTYVRVLTVRRVFAERLLFYLLSFSGAGKSKVTTQKEMPAI